MRIDLSKITGLSVGGGIIEIDTAKDMDYDDGVEVVDEDDDCVASAEGPVLAFTGKDGHRYAVNMVDVSVFQYKP